MTAVGGNHKQTLSDGSCFFSLSFNFLKEIFPMCVKETLVGNKFTTSSVIFKHNTKQMTVLMESLIVFL